MELETNTIGDLFFYHCFLSLDHGCDHRTGTETGPITTYFLMGAL